MTTGHKRCEKGISFISLSTSKSGAKAEMVAWRKAQVSPTTDDSMP